MLLACVRLTQLSTAQRLSVDLTPISLRPRKDHATHDRKMCMPSVLRVLMSCSDFASKAAQREHDGFQLVTVRQSAGS